jgi:hypothetical protein
MCTRGSGKTPGFMVLVESYFLGIVVADFMRVNLKTAKNMELVLSTNHMKEFMVIGLKIN